MNVKHQSISFLKKMVPFISQNGTIIVPDMIIVLRQPTQCLTQHKASWIGLSRDGSALGPHHWDGRACLFSTPTLSSNHFLSRARPPMHASQKGVGVIFVKQVDYITLTYIRPELYRHPCWCKGLHRGANPLAITHGSLRSFQTIHIVFHPKHITLSLKMSLKTIMLQRISIGFRVFGQNL